jgi:hypothetical protein
MTLPQDKKPRAGREEREADEWLSSAIRCTSGALDRAQQASPAGVRAKLEELARLGRQAGVLAERE